MAGHTIVTYDTGAMARTIDGFTPDVAYFDPNLPSSTRPNRLPADIKPSYKWSLAMANSPIPRDQREFKQVLSQVNFYMIQHHARDGFVLTNRELVAIRCLDRNGNLELSASIPLTASGSPTHLRLTVLLAMWYLGMLASENNGWYLEWVTSRVVRQAMAAKLQIFLLLAEPTYFVL